MIHFGENGTVIQYLAVLFCRWRRMGSCWSRRSGSVARPPGGTMWSTLGPVVWPLDSVTSFVPLLVKVSSCEVVVGCGMWRPKDCWQ